MEPTLVRKGALDRFGRDDSGNVTIGESAIVGAGSVVTETCLPNAIVAGNPARVLRILTAEGSEGMRNEQDK